MKNKPSSMSTASIFLQLRRTGLLVATGLLFFSVAFSARLLALPAASYRYSTSQCGGSDAQCFKYSSEAGVYRGYRGTLNRNPEPAGLAFWKARLQNGSSSLTDFMASLLGSAEWRGKYQSLNNSQFVTQSYQFVLKRSPDTNGHNYWLGQLNSGGHSRAQMVASMVNSSESANVHHGAFMSYYQPPAPSPAPTPAPAPAPAAKPSSNFTPSRQSQSGSENTGPVASNISDSGMQITDLVVSEQDYRSALISWNTTKPSMSKINFGTNQEDLNNEQLKEEPVTAHSLRLEGDDLRAGHHYYLRVTADDGSGAITIDTEFDTTAIPVIIKVTNEQSEAVAEATVFASDQEVVTDTNGEVTMELPEGEVTIFAQKDELSREIQAEIEIPKDENTQRITLALSKSAPAANKPAASKNNGWWLWTILGILFVGLVGGFLFWRRRNQKKAQAQPYFGDALEAENYTSQVVPSTPPEQLSADPEPKILPEAPPAQVQPTVKEPTYLPVEDPSLPHHASLPELVGRYGSQADESSAASIPDVPGEISPTGQPVPAHVSLKDLVAMPASTAEQPAEPDPTINDLPISPEENKTNLAPKQSVDKPEDNSLNIKH